MGVHQIAPNTSFPNLGFVQMREGSPNPKYVKNRRVFTGKKRESPSEIRILDPETLKTTERIVKTFKNPGRFLRDISGF